MDFTMAISFGRFAFLKLTDFTDFCKNSVACETFLWYDNVCKFKELANAQIAQLVEQRTENPRVAGSIPALGTICGLSSSGRAPPCQGGGSEFEPRRPLHSKQDIRFGCPVFC